MMSTAILQLAMGRRVKTLVLTCPELDGGRRQSRFPQSRFPDVEFITGMSRNRVEDPFSITANTFNFGYENAVWDDAALAVAYGHFRAWKHVLELGQRCLVLEDDARPVSKRVLDYYQVEEILGLAHLPAQWIVTLWLQGISRYQDYDATFHEVVPSYANHGLVGYILNPATGKILVDHFPTISCPVDHYVLGMGFAGCPLYKVLVSHKNLIRHGPRASLRDISRRPRLERLCNKGKAVIDWL